MTHLRLLIIAILTFTFLTALHAEPLGTAFTYQGQLVQSGTEVTDVCDFNFGLWDSRTNGTEVAEAFDSPNVNVNEGIFSVELDFGSRNFDGNPRWLEIAVVCPAGGGALTTLAPRQVLTATPYALFASEAGNSAGANFDTAASSSGVALTTADAIIASVTITAPAAGLVIVNANGWFNLKNSVSNHARCSVTTGVFVETATAIRARFPTFASDLFVPMARTRVFPLVDPGSVTFNLVCDEVVGNIDINDVVMSAIYVPVTY